PSDLTLVLETVIRNAVRLAGAAMGHIRQYDGEALPIVAQHGEGQHASTLLGVPVHPTARSAVGRAFIERRPVHIPDVDADPSYGGPARAIGGRTVLAVPLLRNDAALGTISMWRLEMAPFTERQIQLVASFADQ